MFLLFCHFQVVIIWIWFQYNPDPSTIVPDPDGLEHMLEYLKATYDNPALYIQENGKFY